MTDTPTADSDVDLGRSVDTGQFKIYINGEEVWSTEGTSVRSVAMSSPLGEAGRVRVAGGSVRWLDILVESDVPEDSNLPLEMVEANRLLASQDLAVEAASKVAENNPMTKAQKDRAEGVEDSVTNPTNENVDNPQNDQGVAEIGNSQNTAPADSNTGEPNPETDPNKEQQTAPENKTSGANFSL